MNYKMRHTVKDVIIKDMITETAEDTIPDEQREGCISRETLQDSSEWVRSIGMNVLCTHYRERDGTQHAICPPGADTCYIHEDRENAHTNPVSHLVKDAPELLVLAGIGLAFGPAAMKKAWRFLP